MIVPGFDGTNYGYWKAHMRFFLKSIDCWKTVETGGVHLLLHRGDGLLHGAHASLNAS
jgi:hypothetical protein